MQGNYLFGRALKLGLGFLLVTLLAGFSGKKSTNPLEIELNLDQRKLDNGLVVIMAEDRSVPVVSYQTWFKVGSVDERPGMTGITHLFEHLMFKGTSKYGPKEYSTQLEAKGAEVNAFTTRDYTEYYINTTPELLDTVIDMESDRMANLVFNEDALQHSRLISLEERRLRYESSIDIRMQEELWRLAYRGHPYHWPPAGFPMDILSVKLSDAEEFYKAYFQPANAVIVVTGNYDREKVFQSIKKHYESIPSQKRADRTIPVEPPQTEERRLVIRDRIVSERFMQAYHITAAENDESYAIDVLSNILFEGRSSRAYKKLVEENAIMIGINGTSYTPGFPGLLIVSGVMKESVPSSRAEVLLDKMISKIQDEGVSEAEIQKAVKQLALQILDSIRTPYGLGQLIGTVQMLFQDPSRFTEDVSKYSKVDSAAVQRVARKYIFPNNRTAITLVRAP